MTSFVANMDMVTYLHSILINTFNADPSLRADAESNLKKYFTMADALSCLICFIGNHEVHRDLRQAAAIAMKNNSKDIYRTDERMIPVSDHEKERAKSMLLEVLLAETDNSVRGLLAETTKNISEFEYPERWPTLLPTLLSHIQTTDILKMYNSLIALRKIVKRYEYKSNEKRQPLNDMVEISFPILQNLLTHIVDNNSIEAAQVIRMILKIFWSATQYALPLVRGIDVNLWFSIMAKLLDKRLPEASEGIEPTGQPLSKEERNAWPWWKMKKWVGRILQHFMSRYGNPQYCSEEYKSFALHFRSTTAPTLLVSIMKALASYHTEGCYMTENVHRACLAFLAGAVEMSPTYKFIKTHLDFVLFQVIFPTMSISNDDIRLFEEDPVEFVRKVHNPMEDWVDPRIAATNVLQTLARYRQKDTLPKLLPFCQAILIEFNKTPLPMRDHRKKDGVIVAIASIATIMSESNKYKAQIEPFLTAHVIPEFQSPVGFMRCRASWAMEYFGDLVNWKKCPEILKVVLKGLLQGLKDPCIPTQTAAACALR
eukprot:gene11336-23725_t